MKFLVFALCLFFIGCDSEYHWTPKLHNTITFSGDFTEEEKAYILHGFGIWGRETNCDVRFDEVENGEIVIKKPNDDEYAKLKEKLKKEIAGLAVLAEEKEVYLIFQNFDSFEELELTAAHEAGHHLGLEHVPEGQLAIMNPALSKKMLNAQHLTEYDLNQFNNYWRCK